MNFTEMDKKINNYKTIYVHSGAFHSDDLLSVVFMQKLNPNIVYKRINEVTDTIKEEAKSGKALICDIGNIYDKENNMFDHHQEDDDNLIAPRPAWERDKTKTHYYSAFGLLWKNFGDYYCEKFKKSNDFKKMFTEIIVSQIDARDNGVYIEDNMQKYKTNFPQLIKSMFMPTTFDVSTQKNVYDKSFVKALEYTEKYFSTHVSNINKVCNSNATPYEKSLFGYVSERKREIKTIKREITKLLREKYFDENSFLFKYMTEFTNFNQDIKKIQSELTKVKNIIYDKSNEIEVSKMIEMYKINKNRNSYEVCLDTKDKVSSSVILDYYKYPQSPNNKHTKIVHVDGCFYNKALDIKDYLFTEYKSKDKNFNYFIYDISRPNSFYHSGYGENSVSLNDIYKSGGILVLICSNKHEVQEDKLQELINNFSKDSYYLNREKHNINNKLIVISTLDRDTERKLMIENNEYKVQNTPIANVYTERGTYLLNFNIPNLCRNTVTLEGVEKISPKLYMAKDKKLLEAQVASVLLTTKIYSDIKIGKNNNFDFENIIEKSFNDKTVASLIYNSAYFEKIISRTSPSQFNLLEKSLTSNEIELSPKAKKTFENKKIDVEASAEYQYIKNDYKFEFNNKSHSKYFIRNADIVNYGSLRPFEDFERNYEK